MLIGDGREEKAVFALFFAYFQRFEVVPEEGIEPPTKGL